MEKSIQVRNFISRSLSRNVRLWTRFRVNLFVGLGRLHPRRAHCVQGLLHLLSWCSGRTEDFLCEERPTFPRCRTTRSSPSPTPTQSCPKKLYDRIREAEKIVDRLTFITFIV